MRKFAISLITILLIGIGAFYGIKTWENQKNDLNQPQKSVQKVSHINLVALGDSLTEGVGDEKNMKGYSGRIAKKFVHNTTLVSLLVILVKQGIDLTKSKKIGYATKISKTITKS